MPANFGSGEGIVYSHCFATGPFPNRNVSNGVSLVLNCYFVGPGVLIRCDYIKLKNDHKGRLLFW